MRIVSMLLCLSLVLCAAVAGGAMPVPLVQCPVATSPVVIDGEVSEAAWGAAPVLGPFVTLHGDHYPRAQTEARVLRSDTALLFAVKIFEPEMQKIVASVTERDKGVWSDDSIEIFVKPGAGDAYYQFISNSISVQEDGKSRDPAWNGAWQAKAGRFAEGWTLEVAIPFDTVGIAPRAGERITFNVCRERPHAREYTAWANPGGSFHHTTRFAEMLFVEQPSFWWRMQAPDPIRTAAGALTMQASGPTATYPVTITTYKGGEMVRQSATAFKCIAGEQHTVQFPFSVPGTELPGVEVAITDARGVPVMRTGIRPLEVTDATQYELGRVEALLAGVKNATLPPRLAARAAGWQARLEQLRLKSSLSALRLLAQELSAAALVAALPAQSRDVAGLPFVLPVFKATDYTLVPPAEAVNQPVKITAARGEYEPAALHLLALEDLQDVALTLDDLRDGQQVLKAEHVEVRLVKNWFQAGTDNIVGASAVFVPELLLTDDRIITPDYAKQRDIFHFDLAVGPEQPAKLQPFAIPAFTNRQWWLLLHVPEGQEPGRYTGTLTITAGGKRLAAVPFQVTVLPFALEATEGLFSMYFHSVHTLGQDPRADAFYESTLAMCARYGMNSLFIQEGGDVQQAGETFQVEAAAVRKALELRSKYGLTADTQYMGLHWRVPVLDKIWTMEEEALQREDDPTVQGFLAFCRAVKELRDAVKFPGRLDIYTHDEPGYDPTGKRLAQSRVLNALVHQAGLTAAQAITLDAARKLGDNLDQPVLSGENLLLGTRKAPEGIKPPLYYYHPLEHPIHDRLHTGLVPWYNGFRGAVPYALAALGGWDDWKGYGNYRPERYIYDGNTAPIPTIQFEGYREGVDDFKYLEMLHRRVTTLPERVLTAAEQQVVDEAMRLVSVAPAPFHGAVEEVERRVTVEDFAALRARCQQLVVKLDGIAGGR